MSEAALDALSPKVASWFRERFGAPTPAQAASWPLVAGGEHALVVAPTGSGKTLAAFLVALDRLFSGASPRGGLRALYVSPLKALGNDVRRNLLGPLAELAERHGESAPPRVLVRHGDTDPGERRRMLREPPEILVTTPESLSLMLTAKKSRALFAGLELVIVDEVHAVAGTKRGAALALSLERLVEVAGEVQRVALSATVEPVERVAAYLGGCSAAREGEEAAPRPVRVVRDPAGHALELLVDQPAALPEIATPGAFWPALALELKRLVREARSTIVFTPSRRAAEKATRLVNEGEERRLAFAHHGSLSREVRASIEERMKRGLLPAIVATSSLELGIDVGALERVVLVDTPLSVSSALQRIGRAGHAVGAISRARLYPSHPRDLLDAAVLARGVLAREVEELRPPRAPLDVLAQQLLAELSAAPRSEDELFALARRADPYRELSRRAFTLVVGMLEGRYEDARVHALAARIMRDPERGALEARPGAARLVYLSGGTIPDRGAYALRVAGGGPRLGELDEEFVWERRVGDTFTLGAQTWRVERIGHSEVEVTPSARAGREILPFWRADEPIPARELGRARGAFLERADEDLAQGHGDRLEATLVSEHGFTPRAAASLTAWLQEQRGVAGRPLPHARHALVEHIEDEEAGEDARRVVLHASAGARAHRALALALAALFERREGRPLDVGASEDGLLLAAPRGFDLKAWLRALAGEELEPLVRGKLSGSPLIGARFREAAGIALLLPRRGFRQRTPLWMTRRRAKALAEALAGHDDFPITLEAWRACLHEDLDLEGARAFLDALDEGTIALGETTTPHASPLARELIWRRTNAAVYEDDTPSATGAAAPRAELIRELALSDALRVRVPRELADRFDARARRVAPGYGARDARELYFALRESLALTRAELDELVAACARESGGHERALARELAPRLRELHPGEEALFVAREDAARFERALRDDPSAASRAEDAEPDARERAASRLGALLAEWLRGRGLVPLARVRALFGQRVDDALGELVAREEVVVDALVEDEDEPQVALREHLEALYRIARAARRPAFEPLPASALPLLFAWQQGLLEPAFDAESLAGHLAALAGFPARAEEWETELLPARAAGYQGAWLDALLARGELTWIGCGERTLTFAAEDEHALVRDELGELSPRAEAVLGLFPGSGGRFTLAELAAREDAPELKALSEGLFEAAFAGALTTESFETMRRAIRSGFRVPSAAELASPRARGGGRLGARRAFARFRASRPFEGAWRRLPPPRPADALGETERARERARILLERYGLVFRELCARELGPFAWSRVFRALRLMELSGEVVAGHFVRGVAGPTFARPETLRAIEEGLPDNALFALSARDPASPAGLALDDDEARAWPRRVAGTHLVFEGARLVVVSRRRGRELELEAAPEDPRLPAHLDFARRLLGRAFEPPSVFAVETINAEPAPESAYAPALRALGFRRTPTTLELDRPL